MLFQPTLIVFIKMACSRARSPHSIGRMKQTRPQFFIFTEKTRQSPFFSHFHRIFFTLTGIFSFSPSNFHFHHSFFTFTKKFSFSPVIFHFHRKIFTLTDNFSFSRGLPGLSGMNNKNILLCLLTAGNHFKKIRAAYIKRNTTARLKLSAKKDAIPP